MVERKMLIVLMCLSGGIFCLKQLCKLYYTQDIYRTASMLMEMKRGQWLYIKKRKCKLYCIQDIYRIAGVLVEMKRWQWLHIKKRKCKLYCIQDIYRIAGMLVEWRDDNDFISGKENANLTAFRTFIALQACWRDEEIVMSSYQKRKSQTHGHWQIPLSLLPILQLPLGPLSKTGRHKSYISSWSRKDLFFGQFILLSPES